MGLAKHPSMASTRQLQLSSTAHGLQCAKSYHGNLVVIVLDPGMLLAYFH